MQLTRFSDYALRVLMFANAAGDRLVTIEEMADAYDISRAHLMKVVNAFTRTGYLTPFRGRSGGVRLAMPAEEVVLGDVIRATEPDFALVECSRPVTSVSSRSAVSCKAYSTRPLARSWRFSTSIRLQALP